MALSREQVADAAIAWERARQEANRLKSERASFRCEHESEAEYNEHGYLTAEGVPACWRQHWQDQQGRDCTMPVAEWCQPCRDRQVVHEAYSAVVRRRGGLMRSLQRRAAKAG